MAHTTHNVNLKQPRVLAIMGILQGAIDGLRTPDVAEQLGTTPAQARKLLVAMKAAGMISLVGSSCSAFWCLHGMVKRVTANMRAAKITRRRARTRKAYHRRTVEGIVCKATGYVNDVPDMPIVQRTVQVWPPLHRPPGPPSVFHCGGLV